MKTSIRHVCCAAALIAFAGTAEAQDARCMRLDAQLRAIDQAMQVSPADLGHDIDLKVNPGGRTSVLDDPEPEREVPPPAASQLFDLSADPAEEHDVAAAQPVRVARMGAELGRWFESVEADRRRHPGHS